MVLALLATTALACSLGGCGATDSLFSRKGLPSDDVQMSAADAASATSQWAAAYMKDPQNPKMALGYARTLKAIGERDRSLDILKTAYQANPGNGEVAAELGRLALETGHLEIAAPVLQTAEAQGIRDWRTLSAFGTLRAKQGKYAEAQQYYLAALELQPDSVSVINNLALSYALDGKADKSEELLRKAVASGHDEKRVRQNLALVLGLQGKFDEARKVASVDMTEQEAKTSMSYLRNMLSSPTRFAAAKPAQGRDAPSGDDWQPFASAAPADGDDKVRAAAAAPAPVLVPGQPKVQIVKPVDEVEPPAAAKSPKARPASAPVQAAAAAPTPIVTPVKAQAGIPTPINPVIKTLAAPQGTTDKAKTIPAAAPSGSSLLRTATD